MSSSHSNGTSSGLYLSPSTSGLSASITTSDHPGPEERSPPEVLGSVVHCHEPENGDKNCCIQLRTSARVSKKLRLDSLANQTPPEKKETPAPKEEEKPEVKPKQRRPWELWPLEDKNTFFEALNEYGKDFEAIQKYFETKAKKKNQPDSMVKNKEQIRHFYYRTWHKISKHLMFPEEVKKGTQELYGLINFGELRKKIGGVSEKTSLKLNELIYRGFTKIRVRGKTVRVKTPICRALRKLNQQEELDEELKLPTHVAIELRPRTNEAWARVQSVAHNPRLHTLLPLQRRLSTLIAYLEEKWQPRGIKHCSCLKAQLDAVSADISSLEAKFKAENGKEMVEVTPSTSTAVTPDVQTKGKETEVKQELVSMPQPKMVLRLAPSSHVAVAPLTVNLSDYFTSSRLSLNSHEERLGNHGAEEMFNAMLLANTKGCNRRGSKRQRHDSSSDKKQQQLLQSQQPVNPPEGTVFTHEKPEYFPVGSTTKVECEDGHFSSPFRLFGSEVNLEIRNGTVSSSSNTSNGEAVSPTAVSSKTDAMSVTIVPKPVSSSDITEKKPNRKNGLTRMADDEKSTSTEEIVNTIRAGWTCTSCNALTIGELYLMFGSESKIMLEYWWEAESPAPDLSTPVVSDAHTNQVNNKVSVALRKLLSIVKLHSFDKTKLLPCPCGHVCNGVPKSLPLPKPKAPKPIRIKADVDNQPRVDCTLDGVVINKSTGVPSSLQHDGPFRRPLIPSVQFRHVPMTGEVEAFKAQLEKFRPRYCNRRGRPASSRKTVVVPRMLPLLPKAPSSSSLLAVQKERSSRRRYLGRRRDSRSTGLSSGGQSGLPDNVLPQSANEFISSNIINVPPTGKVAIQRVARKSEVITLPTVSATAVASLTNTVIAQATASVASVEATPSPLPVETPSCSTQQNKVCQERVETSKPSAHVRNSFPPVINEMMDTRVTSPPSISTFLDMSLSSELGLSSTNGLLETANFAGLLNSDAVPTSSTPTSPSSILKEDENQWLNSDLCDFSLSSFLGQLESPSKREIHSAVEATTTQDSRDVGAMTSDVERQMQCLMAENSLDYIGKFADLAAQIASDGNNKPLT